VTLSALHATAHLGAHADAPSHIGADGRAIHECNLEGYLGPCQVIRLPATRGAALKPADVPAAIHAERVLLATGTYPDPEHFNEDFAGLSAQLVEWLHARGVRLVGVDTPSVDLFAATDLPAHRACLRCGMAILEGLALGGVPDGLYELIALPLKLVGFDGSPVRAVLRSLPTSGV
jgi:arylformamidase